MFKDVHAALFVTKTKIKSTQMSVNRELAVLNHSISIPWRNMQLFKRLRLFNIDGQGRVLEPCR